MSKILLDRCRVFTGLIVVFVFIGIASGVYYMWVKDLRFNEYALQPRLRTNTLCLFAIFFFSVIHRGPKSGLLASSLVGMFFGQFIIPMTSSRNQNQFIEASFLNGITQSEVFGICLGACIGVLIGQNLSLFRIAIKHVNDKF